MNIHLYRLYHCIRWKHILFPKASERRVLLLVGVCYIHLQTSSHLRIFWSSHLLIFSSYIFTSSHLHIFLIFPPSHLTSSHLLIFTSFHLHIFTSSHLHTFTSFIFTSSHLFILSSSHLRIFSFSHLHIFSSSHLRIFSLLLSYPLALSPCCLLALLPSSLSFFSISLLRRGTVPTRRHEMQPFRTKWGSIAKNWDKLAIFKFPAQLRRTKWVSIVKNWGKIAIFKCPSQLFARNEVRGTKLQLGIACAMKFGRRELK